MNILRVVFLFLMLIPLESTATDFSGDVNVGRKVTAKSSQMSGTAGTGYMQLDHQSSDVATPGSASNNVRLFTKSKKLYTATDNGSGTAVIAEVGSGAGGGSINYITDKDAESTVVGYWVTYADAPGVAPVNGVDGSPTAAWSVTQTTALRGTYSYMLSKDIGNRQGEGASVAFSTALADASKMITIEFSYKASANYNYGSGTAALPGDVVVYVFDVTNGILIQPTNYMLNGGGKYTGQFQTDSTSTSYRLILHIAQTSSGTSWELRVDDISVGPKSVAKGPITTDWVSYTPTFTNVSGGTKAGKWRRNGDSMEVYASATAITDVTNPIEISIPSGYAIDTTKLSTTTDMSLGSAFGQAATSIYTGSVVYATTTTVSIAGDNNAGYWSTTRPADWTTSDRMSVNFRVPIVGWGSNTVVSSTSTGRSIYAGARRITSGQTYTAGSPNEVIFNSARADNTGSYSTTTGRFTAPESGRYSFKASVLLLNGATAATNARVFFQKNGTTPYYGQWFSDAMANSKKYMPTIAADIDMNAGDYVSVWVYPTDQNMSGDYDSTNDMTSFYVSKIIPGETIAASEVVAVALTSTNNAATLTEGSEYFIKYENIDINTHGAITQLGSTGTSTTAAGTQFTAPIAGIYQISAAVWFGGAAWAAGASDYVDLRLFKNGVSYVLNEVQAAGSSTYNVQPMINATIKLNAGDTIKMVVAYAATGSNTQGIVASANKNFLFINRIGGVM